MYIFKYTMKSYIRYSVSIILFYILFKIDLVWENNMKFKLKKRVSG